MIQLMKAMTALCSCTLLLSACGVHPRETTPRTVASELLGNCPRASMPGSQAIVSVAQLSGRRATFAGGDLSAFLYAHQLSLADPGTTATTASPSSQPRMAVNPLPSRQTMVASLARQIDDKASRMASTAANAPKSLRDNKVVRTLMRTVVVRKLEAFRSAVVRAPDSAVMSLFNDASLDALAASRQVPVSAIEVRAILGEAIDGAVASQQPEYLTYDDFKELYHALLDRGLDRVVQYEADYFNGNFIDRFGNSIPKPQISNTVSNDDIAGALTVLLEAIADEIFPDTPVWAAVLAEKPGKAADSAASPSKAGGRVYYPGGSSKPPSVLVFRAKREGKEPENLADPIFDPNAEKDPSGCGMTKLKAEALIYVSGKASTWASGQAGLVLGALGGANFGLPIVLGKISIGDNKTLQIIVQTALAFTARRAAYEATWPLLYQIDEPRLGTVGQILRAIVFQSEKEAAK